MTRKTSQWTAAETINAATEFLARNAGGNARVSYGAMLAWLQANAGSSSGKSPEFQLSGDYLQWRLVGDTAWNNLVALSAISGRGVPDGGTTGQILAKKSATANDTQWIDPPSGGGSGTVNTTGDQTIAGRKKFTGIVEFSNGPGVMISTLALLTPAPASGSTLTLTPGVSYQEIKPAADLATLTVKLPDWPDGGFVINLITTQRVAAVTFVGGIHNAGTAAVIGAPAALEVGITSAHFFINDNAWYFYK